MLIITLLLVVYFRQGLNLEQVYNIKLKLLNHCKFGSAVSASQDEVCTVSAPCAVQMYVSVCCNGGPGLQLHRLLGRLADVITEAQQRPELARCTESAVS